MTREEAITALGDRSILLFGMSKEEQKYYSEALDMAISALSADGEYIKKKDVLSCFTWQNTKEDVWYAIKDLPTFSFPDSAENTGEWIPVSKRLPEPNRLVICYISTGATETYFIAFWNDIQKAWEEGIGGCRLLECDLGYEVIAWQPLPKPYKGE